jgi:hypothetical protein
VAVPVYGAAIRAGFTLPYYLYYLWVRLRVIFDLEME